MSPTPRTWPTFAAELLAARATLRLPDEVGLAIRADRHRLHLSQRAYAVRRRMSSAMVARLETRSGELKLDDVIRALDGTAFVLCLCHRGGEGESPALAGSVPQHEVPRHDPGTGPPTTPGHVEPSGPTPVRPRGADTAGIGPTTAPTPVSPCFWPRSELVARVRDGSRRFPAHHHTAQVSRPPLWWWYSEATWAYAKEPNWYAPRWAPWGEAS